MKKLLTLIVAMGMTVAVSAQDLPKAVFMLDFEGVTSAEAIGAEQVGDGEFRVSENANFGTYYQNKPNGTEKTSHVNYLIVPSQGFINAQAQNGQQVSICLWVNGTVANAIGVDHFYSTLISAYNSSSSYKMWQWPMFSARARGTLQINCGGWSDFVAGESATGVVVENNDWIKNNVGENFDDNWHFVAIVIDGQNYKYYIDNVIVNEWNTNATEGSNNYQFTTVMDQLDQIYLGDCGPFWQDEDPAYAYDDVAIYPSALTSDDIQLIMDVKQGKLTPEILLMVAKNKYQVAFDDLTAYAGQIGEDGYTLLGQTLDDYAMEYTIEEETVEAYNKGANDMAAKLAEAQAVVKQCEAFKAECAAIEAFANATQYPGYEAFMSALGLATPDYSALTSAEPVAEGKVKLAEAKAAYLFSQELPADGSGIVVTKMIQHPWFVEEAMEPTLDENGLATYPTDNPGAYLNNGGWENTSTVPGSDCTMYYTQGRTTWNNFHSSTVVGGILDIHQTVGGLKPGYYTVSADMASSSAASDNHVYASANDALRVSPVFSGFGWDAVETGIAKWETLTTDKIYVGEDGTLLLGATSTTNGDMYTGWYCATNFVLTYYGTDVDLDAELAAKVEQANSTIADMQLGGDIAKANEQLKAVLESNMTDYDKISQISSYITDEWNKWIAAETSFTSLDDFTVFAETEEDSELQAIELAVIKNLNATFSTITYDQLPKITDTYKEFVVYSSIVKDAKAWGKTEKLAEQFAALKGDFTLADLKGYGDELIGLMKADIASKDASKENPVDVSFLIKNASFRTNDSYMWEGDVPAVSFNEAEFFNRNFDIHQTLTDMPKGMYRLVAKGFYRDGANDVALPKYPAATAYNVKLYLNDAVGNLHAWASDSLVVADGSDPYSDDDYTESFMAYYPNSMSTGAQYFADGYYAGSFAEYAHEEDGDITLGLKKQATIANDWALFTDFELYYLGNAMPSRTDDYRVTCGEEGNVDYAFWEVFSDYYTLKNGNTAHFQFTNNSDMVNNWDNWILVAANGERGSEGYKEYFVLRADNYGWGDLYGTGTLVCDYNWDTFKQDMNGAEVDMNVTYKNGMADMVATIVTVDGKTYHYSATGFTGITDEEITLFFTTEKANLQNGIANYLVTCGEAGNVSYGFWEVFSDYYTLKNDHTAHFQFTNYSDMVNNWDNWLLVAANGERGSEGYKEYFVLRADNYGWGDLYGTGSLVCDYNWDTFKQDMNGAAVDMNVTYSNGKVDMVATIVTADDSKSYNYSATGFAGITDEEITLFFTTEKANLQGEYVTAIDDVPSVIPASTTAYNLQGQVVGADYKGIVIQNGKKMLKK